MFFLPAWHLTEYCSSPDTRARALFAPRGNESKSFFCIFTGSPKTFLRQQHADKKQQQN